MGQRKLLTDSAWIGRDVSSEETRRKEVLAYRTRDYTLGDPEETSKDPKKIWKN